MIRFLFLYIIIQFSFAYGIDVIELNNKIDLLDTKSLIDFWEKEKAFAKTENSKAIQLKLRYIESYIADRKQLYDIKIQKLLWIIENSSEEDKKITAFANYHLASLLNLQSGQNMAEFYANDALKIAHETKCKELIHLCYSLLGSIHYNLKLYDEASIIYKKAFQFSPKNDLLFKASMLNNISLCKFNMNDYHASSTYIYRSLHYLNQLKKPSTSDKIFEIIVEGNLGTNFHRIGNLKKAIFYLEKEASYYEKHQVELMNAHKPLSELLECYQQLNNIVNLKKTESRLLKLEEMFKNTNTAYAISKDLLNFYIQSNQESKIKKYAEIEFKNNKIILDSTFKSFNHLTNILYKQEVQNAKKEIKNQQELNVQLETNRKRTSLFIIVFFSLISIILLVLYIERSQRLKKNELIDQQRRELEESKRFLLENEVKINQEKISKLALNLTIKKEMENAFLHQLKEIKRRKIIDPVELIKELQQKLTNLLQIDDKQTNLLMSDENEQYIKRLIQKHPNLLEFETQLCSYFKIKLSSKEIASLTGMTAGTIRVYKSKIKNKLNIDENIFLNDYLASI